MKLAKFGLFPPEKPGNPGCTAPALTRTRTLEALEALEASLEALEASLADPVTVPAAVSCSDHPIYGQTAALHAERGVFFLVYLDDRLTVVCTSCTQVLGLDIVVTLNVSTNECRVFCSNCVL